jgi:predicted nucleic acid-binding Zn ribbon protein
VSHDDEAPDTGATPPEHLNGLAGMDLVRRTLAEAREAARSQGKDVGQGRRAPLRRRTPGSGGGRRSWSGPGPDRRDPQTLGAATRDLAQARGWSAQVAEGTVLGRWRAVVGEDIASLATQTRLSEVVLIVAAESTDCANQLRLVQAQLLAKIAAAVGDGVVTTLKITGPTAPSWRKGPLHVSGRGPRDTYG